MTRSVLTGLRHSIIYINLESGLSRTYLKDMNLAKCIFAVLGVGLLLSSCDQRIEPVPVTGITISANSLTMVVGETQTLTATVSPNNADNKAVIWSSSNGSVATVDNGKVTAIGIGSTTITVKSDDGGKTATCNVTVNSQSVSVTGVLLDMPSLDLVEGETATLVATVNPPEASNKNVIWYSSDASVASVDQNGVVSAVKAGSATVSVTTEDGGKKAECLLMVRADLLLHVSPSNLEFSATIGASDTKSFEVSNIGRKTLEFHIVNPSCIEFSLPDNADGETLFSLAAGQKKSINVVYTPSKANSTSEDRISIISNSSDEYQIVSLSGTCPAIATGTVAPAVDLGLSVKWAAWNIGASAENQIGQYFSWGETETKSLFDWTTYKWGNGGEGALTKYCYSTAYGNVDNKYTLDIEDDAATANWGNEWRMPTVSEMQELQEQCTWEFTTQEGTEGFKVTSNIKGYTDKFIFLPLSGWYDGREVMYLNVGYFLSNSLGFDSNGAWGMIFGIFANETSIWRGNCPRCYGCPVRAVTEKSGDGSEGDGSSEDVGYIDWSF